MPRPLSINVTELSRVVERLERSLSPVGDRPLLRRTDVGGVVPTTSQNQVVGEDQFRRFRGPMYMAGRGRRNGLPGTAEDCEGIFAWYCMVRLFKQTGCSYRTFALPDRARGAPAATEVARNGAFHEEKVPRNRPPENNFVKQEKA